MRKLPRKELKELFRSKVAEVGWTCSKENPFILQADLDKFYVFIKNISPAYFKNSPDISRVQLPTSARFKSVSYSELLFVILGYDVENDVFVSWNPYNVKERLNSKSNVSLYSRFSLQSEVSNNEFKEGFLSNGEKIILFKRALLNEFFNQLTSLFSDEMGKEDHTEPEEKSSSNEEIEIIKNLIDPLLKQNRVLEAVSLLAEKYKNHPKYLNLKFKDWFDIVNERYQDLFTS